MLIVPNFTTAINTVGKQLRLQSYEVRGARWQSIDVSTKPEMRMREILNVSFQVSLAWNENLDHYRGDINPNLPWADDHFEERVGGNPLNPGQQWKNWPWALAADKHRKAGGEDPKFSHTYMERYWPKRAGFDEVIKHYNQHTGESLSVEDGLPRMGIRYQYGDLNDVVDHLLGDPLSRQAYLPVWLPEDTGVVHGERVPCSLGYHWIQRNGYLHTTYYIRSCDYVRHFRDDLYLTVRLTLWVLDQLRQREKRAIVEGNDSRDQIWHEIKTGAFTFHCVSMHLFQNDWQRLFGAKS